jgi:uncharacterized protein YbaP (TraB family)
MKKFIAKITLITFVSSYFACGNPESKGFKTSEKFSLLWEISGNNLPAPSYLYGTIHSYDSSMYKLPKEVFEAIDLCDNFALEIDMSKIDQKYVIERTLIQYEDSTLNLLLRPDVYSEIRKVPFIMMLGDAVNKIKPVFLVAFLIVENPMTIQPVEAVLNAYAAKQNKNIFGIETIEEQYDAFDKISLKEQANSINELYDYCKAQNNDFLTTCQTLMKRLSGYYMEQNFEAVLNLEKEFKITNNSIFNTELITKRNIIMADRINDWIKDGKTLFAGIGMLHLPDENSEGIKGVVTLLKEKGYTLRPILIELKK